jgi:hypothetical protein
MPYPCYINKALELGVKLTCLWNHGPNYLEIGVTLFVDAIV